MSKKTTARMPDSTPAQGLLASLGLYGLSHLDAPVLAALSLETPMLLIGPHGSAKSALLQRLATALGLAHRHYNASLLSFDDLVGFPVPEGDGLKYLHTPATLWGAQSVFLDEISRCRPEIQNKLFSIIHERRVQGLELTDLRYRWAAMNPPVGPDSLNDETVYIGSTPLDPALADRFSFVLVLPALEDLTPEARRQVIRSGLNMAGEQSSDINLSSLVATSQRLARHSMERNADWITAYISRLAGTLNQAGLTISGRRAAMLAANIAGIQGAREALHGDATLTEAGEPPALADSALMALRHGLPQRAQGQAIDAGLLATMHRQVLDALTQALDDATLARILDEAHPVRRVGMALSVLENSPGRIGRNTLSLLVSDALAAQDKQPRWLLSQLLLPNIAALDCVDVPTLELLAEPFTTQVDYEARPSLRHQIPRSRIGPFNALVTALDQLDADDPDAVALGNLGAALYSTDEGAAVPEHLVRQQAALRTKLEEGAKRAR